MRLLGPRFAAWKAAYGEEQRAVVEPAGQHSSPAGGGWRRWIVHPEGSRGPVQPSPYSQRGAGPRYGWKLKGFHPSNVQQTCSKIREKPSIYVHSGPPQNAPCAGKT
jgi:hypothetical protein